MDLGIASALLPHGKGSRKQQGCPEAGKRVLGAQHRHRALTDLDCIVGFILGLGPRIFPMLLRFCRGENKPKPFRAAELGSFPVPSLEITPLPNSAGLP